jgi:hypothetical protein
MSLLAFALDHFGRRRRDGMMERDAGNPESET